MIIFILPLHPTFVLDSLIDMRKRDKMALNRRLYETICLILIINFFYEGVYKIVNFNSYSYWLKHVPILKFAGTFLSFFIPGADIAATVMLLLPRMRNTALYGIIIGEMLTILWVMGILLFTGWLIFPFQTFWDKPNWMEKMLFGLTLSWLALAAIFITNGENGKYSAKKLLRKTPANVN